MCAELDRDLWGGYPAKVLEDNPVATSLSYPLPPCPPLFLSVNPEATASHSTVQQCSAHGGLQGVATQWKTLFEKSTYMEKIDNEITISLLPQEVLGQWLPTGVQGPAWYPPPPCGKPL